MLMLISAAGRQPPPESGSAAADAAAPGDGSEGHVWLEGGKVLMREKRCFDY